MIRRRHCAEANTKFNEVKEEEEEEEKERFIINHAFTFSIDST